MSQQAAQERAERAAHELAIAVAELRGQDEADIVIMMRVTVAGGQANWTWDWWGRPLGVARGQSGIDDHQEPAPG